MCLAPKAPSHREPGATPQGFEQPHDVALKERFTVSIPNITLVEINTVPVQQLAVFLLKRASAMVLLLRPDVLQHSAELTQAH